MREISDDEALEDFKKAAAGEDLDNLKLVKLGPKGPEEKTLRDVLKSVEREVKGKKEKRKTVDLFGREKLERQKAWIKYKIEKGWMK